MAINAFLLSILLIFLTKPSPAASLISNATIQEVTETLSNNGYNAMALTLQFGPRSMLSSPYFTLTIFAPQDSAFSKSGQPSLSLLSYHICPLYIPFSSLRSFPFGTQIPTISRNNSLFVTSSKSGSVNGVNIDGPAIFDDGFVVVYGIEKFFDQDFQASDLVDDDEPNDHNLGCSIPAGNGLGHGHHPYAEASEVLRSRGYSSIASILDMQLELFQNQSNDRALTIFAPSDRALLKFKHDRNNLRPLVLRHVLPCRIPMRVLDDLGDGVMLSTFLEGFFINTTKSKSGLKLNGVPFVDPDLYSNNWLIVHGIDDVIRSEDESHRGRATSSSKRISWNSNFLFVLTANLYFIFFPVIAIKGFK